MQEIIEADLVIYNGANMESFIPAIEESVKDKNKFLNLSQGLTLLESGDGLEEEHEHGDEKIKMSMDMINQSSYLVKCEKCYYSIRYNL